MLRAGHIGCIKMAKLILQIYEGDTPLTLVETARVIQGLQDSQIRETANMTYNEGGENLPRRCDNRRHDLYRKCVGGGVCLAKKYKRCELSADQICSTCESKVITDTLNWMFERYYGGKYTAAWRRTRATKRSKPEREKATKKRGEEKKREQLEILNGMAEKPKPTRKKKVAPRDNQKPKSKKEPEKDKKLAVTKTKKTRGRPRRRQSEAA